MEAQGLRRLLWAFTVILLLSGCSGKGDKLVFFYDQDFGQVAEYTPALFLGEEKPFFQEISSVALESGYSLAPVPVDILDENYITIFKNKLSSSNKQVVITSFLYSVPEIQALLADYQVAVVGAALDIPLDKLKIIGNGFRVIEEEGQFLASSGKNIRFVALRSGFQQLIKEAFLNGAGADTKVFETGLNSPSIIMPLSYDLIVASYGPCFKSFSSPQSRTGSIRVLNYPGAPEYVDQNMKKKVEAYICYDFATSFKSAILELASNQSEKKSFYSFDLIRR